MNIVIDEAYMASFISDPEGPAKLMKWFGDMMDERDDARRQAAAAGLGCFTAVQAKLKAEARSATLLESNNQYLFDKRLADARANGHGSMMLEMQQECIIMRKALRKCSEQFAFYEEQHRAKGTPEADAKAKVNQDMQVICDKAANGWNCDGDIARMSP